MSIVRNVCVSLRLVSNVSTPVDLDAFGMASRSCKFASLTSYFGRRWPETAFMQYDLYDFIDLIILQGDKYTLVKVLCWLTDCENAQTPEMHVSKPLIACGHVECVNASDKATLPHGYT